LRAAANAVILSFSLKKNPGAGAWDNKNKKPDEAEEEEPWSDDEKFV
jgi:hypothetical protein